MLEIALPLDASFGLQRDLLTQLERYAVRYRYPGESADKDEARAAFQALQLLRAFMRERLELHD